MNRRPFRSHELKQWMSPVHLGLHERLRDLVALPIAISGLTSESDWMMFKAPMIFAGVGSLIVTRVADNWAALEVAVSISLV